MSEKYLHGILKTKVNTYNMKCGIYLMGKNARDSSMQLTTQTQHKVI